MYRRELEITDFEKKKEILGKSKVLHLGLCDNGIPYVVALNYGYEFIGDQLYLYMHCSSQGYKLDLIRKNPEGSFEIDCDVIPFDGGNVACSFGTSYKSIMGRGTIEIIESGEEKRKLLSAFMKSQTDKDFIFDENMITAVTVLRLKVREYTAKARPLPANLQKPISVKCMRDSDAWTIAHGTPSKELMKRAGNAIANAGQWKAPVAIVCGKGNNAGDGYVAALVLKNKGIDCTIIRASDDFSEDGKYYHDLCLKEGIKSVLYEDTKDLSEYGSILDCLLGTGFRGDVTGVMKDMIDEINRCHDNGTYVVSADINSGLNGDTGLGTTYVNSDLTVSIGAFKTGHFTGLADKAMKDKINFNIGIKIID